MIANDSKGIELLKIKLEISFLNNLVNLFHILKNGPAF